MMADSQRDARVTAWLEEHRGITHKIARAYAASPSDQSDLEQEMAVQLWRSAANFRGEAKPSTWVYRVCLNTALAWRRDFIRRERPLAREADLAQIAGAASSPADQAGDRELLEKLYAAIRALPEFDRALVLLSLDGLVYREMAEVTGLTENHVGVALTRARGRLAEFLKGVAHELE